MKRWADDKYCSSSIFGAIQICAKRGLIWIVSARKATIQIELLGSTIAKISSDQCEALEEMECENIFAYLNPVDVPVLSMLLNVLSEESCSMLSCSLRMRFKDHYEPYRVAARAKNHPFDRGRYSLFFWLITSSYKADVPESDRMLRFCTRHTPQLDFLSVDNQCTSWWGYLPQDLAGRSFFSFVPPKHIPCIIEAQQKAATFAGRPVLSKPYYFHIQNGDVVLLETEWVVLLHPWNCIVDSVVGRHKIILWPGNVDIFRPADQVCRSSVQEISVAQKRLLHIFGQVNANFELKATSSYAKKQLASSSTPDEPCHETDATVVSSPEPQDNFLEALVEQAAIREGMCTRTRWRFAKQNPSISGGESASDSPPNSSGSGPSYNQINLLENVDRYFQSQFDQILTCHASAVQQLQETADRTLPSEHGASACIQARDVPQYEVKLAQHQAANSCLPLTPENLRFFTEKQKFQLKASWKQKVASDTQSLQSEQVGYGHADDESHGEGVHSANRRKAWRHNDQRPASIPLTSGGIMETFRETDKDYLSSFLPQPSACQGEGFADYYRSLGPTPAPPAGQNVQISSAPLPAIFVAEEKLHTLDVLRHQLSEPSSFTSADLFSTSRYPSIRIQQSIEEEGQQWSGQCMEAHGSAFRWNDNRTPIHRSVIERAPVSTANVPEKRASPDSMQEDLKDPNEKL
ncbi:period circadian protein [Trichuris trichiura]|uniref:Period circadian protein n=1 Tax=Trichuris trichiura TaxID=36087 RepID=A0A077Z4S9_TRITR|nr:period circadian protein [Trichuris trichiura]